MLWEWDMSWKLEARLYGRLEARSGQGLPFSPLYS